MEKPKESRSGKFSDVASPCVRPSLTVICNLGQNHRRRTLYVWVIEAIDSTRTCVATCTYLFAQTSFRRGPTAGRAQRLNRSMSSMWFIQKYNLNSLCVVLKSRRWASVDPVYETFHHAKMLRVQPPRGTIIDEDNPKRLAYTKTIFGAMPNRRSASLLYGT